MAALNPLVPPAPTPNFFHPPLQPGNIPASHTYFPVFAAFSPLTLIDSQLVRMPPIRFLPDWALLHNPSTPLPLHSLLPPLMPPTEPLEAFFVKAVMASVMPRQLPPRGYCGRYGAVITPHDGGWCCRGVSKRGRGEGLRGWVGLKILGQCVADRKVWQPVVGWPHVGLHLWSGGRERVWL